MQLAFDRRGAGPPLILLHALGADRRVWDPVFDRLSAERDVVALDLPGFGGSPVLGGPDAPTPAALAGAVAEFAWQLSLDKPHVAGNSLGVGGARTGTGRTRALGDRDRSGGSVAAAPDAAAWAGS